jgi:hypothetical protein
MHKHYSHVMVEILLRLKNRAVDRRGTRIEFVKWHRFVGDELGLHHESGRRVDRLDLVQHCGHRSLHERDQPHGRDLNLLASWRHPSDAAA